MRHVSVSVFCNPIRPIFRPYSTAHIIWFVMSPGPFPDAGGWQEVALGQVFSVHLRVSAPFAGCTVTYRILAASLTTCFAEGIMDKGC